MPAAARSAPQPRRPRPSILAEFLPQQLSEAEISELVRAAIAETGASSPADLGRVMGRVAPQTRGRADGRAVSDIVRRQLAGEG